MQLLVLYISTVHYIYTYSIYCKINTIILYNFIIYAIVVVGWRTQRTLYHFMKLKLWPEYRIHRKLFNYSVYMYGAFVTGHQFHNRTCMQEG